jgi:hypothetical protein
MQKRAPADAVVPHEGQLISSAAPQDMQKRAPCGLAVSQLGHVAPCAISLDDDAKRPGRPETALSDQ